MRPILRSKYLKANPFVFFPSTIIIVLLLILGVFFTEATTTFFTQLQDFIVHRFGWLYLFSVAGFLFFVIWLMCSSYGRIKLGEDSSDPEYSLISWFAMLFSAGMGIGLIFYSVAEPIYIFHNPPSSTIQPDSINAAKEAMRYTFFHWGLHAWGIYIVIGLALAYFSYRHKLPLTIRSTLYPLLGEKIYGFWGNVVETMAVIGTLCGCAASLGVGAMQVNSGLNHLNILSNSVPHQIILILGIILIATISVVSGVDKGIRRLSEVNLLFALLLLVFVFFAGPSTFLLRAFSENIGSYLQTFMQTTLETGIFRNAAFQKNWTLFFWGWWIGSSPFVGMFIAKISKGRTIREFIAGVLLVPSILSFIWLTIFGSTALHMQLINGKNMTLAVTKNMATSVFVMLENLPLTTLTCSLAIIVIVLFFVTSADSAALVVDLLTSGGQKRTPVWQKIFWALSAGGIAIALLLTGGLTALQTAVITSALPFVIIMIFVCFSLWKALKTETEIKKARASVVGQGVILSKNSIAVPGINPIDTPISKTFDPDAQAILANSTVSEQISDLVNDDYASDWRKRLERLKSKTYKEFFADQYECLSDDGLEKINAKLGDFIVNVVKPAFIEIEKELKKYQRDIRISASAHQASIIVMKGDIEEIYYGIRGKAYHKFSYAFPSFNPTNTQMECYAQVVLRSGSRKLHELKKFNKKSIIHDFLNEYEKWAILDNVTRN